MVEVSQGVKESPILSEVIIYNEHPQTGSRHNTPQKMEGSFTISYDMCIKIIQGDKQAEKEFLDFVFQRVT